MLPIAEDALGTEGVATVSIHREGQGHKTDWAALKLRAVSNTPPAPLSPFSSGQLHSSSNHGILLFRMQADISSARSAERMQGISRLMILTMLEHTNRDRVDSRYAAIRPAKTDNIPLPTTTSFPTPPIQLSILKYYTSVNFLKIRSNYN